MNFTEEEWQACLKVLRIAADSPNEVPDINLFKGLVTKINKKAKKIIKNAKLEHIEDHKQTILNQTLRVQHQTQSPNIEATTQQEFIEELLKPIVCYACANLYKKVHFFYHRLCPDCATLNYEKRQQRADLTNKIALVTGGRIKVGYYTALRLLRDGAKVWVTTRFPATAAQSFAQESDFEQWKDRLIIYGLDLRYLAQIEQFTHYFNQQASHLDILINNAAQTIHYPKEYFAPILAQEQDIQQLAPSIRQLIHSQQESSNKNLPFVQQDYFPQGQTDEFGQPLDLRTHNTWTMKLEEVSVSELVEANLVNHIAPFMLISQLKAKILQSPHPQRFILNITSVEGQFSYDNKTVFHPHTNMTKAALNMLTRTSAEDFAQQQIYMNSVDVGWVSTGNPYPKKGHLEEKGFVPPLDSVDAAARIYDVLIQGLTGNLDYGKLYKNYIEVEW